MGWQQVGDVRNGGQLRDLHRELRDKSDALDHALGTIATLSERFAREKRVADAARRERNTRRPTQAFTEAFTRSRDELVVRVDGDTAVAIHKLLNLTGQRTEVIAVVLRIGEGNEGARRNHDGGPASPGRFNGVGADEHALAGGQTSPEGTIDSGKQHVVAATPDPLALSDTNNQKSGHDDSSTQGRPGIARETNVEVGAHGSLPLAPVPTPEVRP